MSIRLSYYSIFIIFMLKHAIAHLQKEKLLQNVAECCKMLQDTISRNREVR